MGKFVRGDIVIIPFPFTDLSDNKKRPAFVAAELEGDDIISGGLRVDSFIRLINYSLPIKI